MTARAPTGSRNPAIDVAKGIAMVAVVISHVMRGARSDGLIADSEAYNLVDTLLYLFHVQLFLIISGYLGWPRANRSDVQRNRQLSLSYSYVLWSALSLAALTATHHPLPADDLSRSVAMLFYAPIQHFWFLPVIMIGYALLYFLRTPLQLAIAITVCATFRLFAGFSYYALDYYLLFFLVGAWLRARPLLERYPVALTTAATAIFLAGTLLCVRAELRPPTVPASVPISLAACYAIYRAAAPVAGIYRIGNAFAEIGRQSLPIFLSHVFFTAGIREAMTHILGPDQAGPIMFASLVAGLLGPLLSLRIAHRLGIERLAGFEPLLR